MTDAVCDERRPERSGAIQVTVIGGYLGAGKTTLVNHILRTADARIAVLVNDFGDINIDEDLIASQDGDTISLANGCICCSLVDGFSSALETVQALDPVPERLVIESSGVADPATVAAYGHGPGLVLDATIVVVDAETIRKKSRDEYVGDTIVGQLGSGDIVVMNKVDLITEDDAAATREWLSDRCPDAVIIDAANGVVDPAVLFGVVEPRDRGAPHEHVNGDDHEAGDHVHAESLFESWSWSSSEPLTKAAVQKLMDALPETVVRAKGLVVVKEEPDQVMALQRVGQRWTLRPFGPRGAADESRIVIIGFHGAVSPAWIDESLS